MSDLGDLVGVLKAAGEHTRLRLLALLSHGQLSVKDLTEILEQSQPRVSRHLKLLADADLVSRQPEGAWAYYGLNESGEAGELARWLIERFDAEDPDRVRDRARLDWVRAAQQSQAAQYFAKVAESWDALRSMQAPDAPVEEAIVASLGDRQVQLLLDLGTGTGRMLELLAPHYRRGIGVDSSREMLAIARAKLSSASISHAQVRLGDIANLDAPAGEADVLVIHQVLHYFDDPGRLLSQVRPALRSGGEMLIVDFAPHDHEFLRTHHAHRRLGISEGQMLGWARGIGLDVADLRLFHSAAKDDGLTVSFWHLIDKAGRAGDAQ